MIAQQIINDMRSHGVTSMWVSVDRLQELQQELTEAIRERNKTVADLIKQRDEAITSARQEPLRPKMVTTEDSSAVCWVAAAVNTVKSLKMNADGAWREVRG